MPQINYAAIRRARARVKEIAVTVAASTLVSSLTAVVSPGVAHSYMSHLIFVLASGILLLILSPFRSRVVHLDAGLVFVFCCFEPIGRIFLHQEAPPHYFFFALVLVLAVAYWLRFTGWPEARDRGES